MAIGYLIGSASSLSEVWLAESGMASSFNRRCGVEYYFF